MDGFDVVNKIAILYLEYKGIIMIVLKMGKTYIVSIVDIPYCSCLDFIKLSSLAVGVEPYFFNFFLN